MEHTRRCEAPEWYLRGGRGTQCSIPRFLQDCGTLVCNNRSTDVERLLSSIRFEHWEELDGSGLYLIVFGKESLNRDRWLYLDTGSSPVLPIYPKLTAWHASRAVFGFFTLWAKGKVVSNGGKYWLYWIKIMFFRFESCIWIFSFFQPEEFLCVLTPIICNSSLPIIIIYLFTKRWPISSSALSMQVYNYPLRISDCKLCRSKS